MFMYYTFLSIIMYRLKYFNQMLLNVYNFLILLYMLMLMSFVLMFNYN